MTGRLLGCEITGLRPVLGGHSRSLTRLADRADGGAVFIKAGGHNANVELAVYEALSGRPFLPRLLASTQDSMLVLEALPPEGWVRDWTPQLVTTTRALLHEIHALPAPPGVPRLGAVPNPWDVIAADPARLLRMGVCSDGWLADHLDILRETAAQAPTAGTA